MRHFYQAGREHANNFDGLRLIAALFVIVSHEFLLIMHWEPSVAPNHTLGNLGVLMFFSISGFLVSLSWRSDPHVGRFLMRRFLRIAPAMFVVITILGYTIYTNGPLWTIPLECRCYLALVVASLIFSRPALPFCLFTLAAYACILGGWLVYFGLFFGMGMLIAEHRALLSWRWLALFLIGAGALALENQASVGLALIVPPLTIGIGVRSWPLLRHAGRFEDLSYGAYIFALPVQKAFIHMLGKDFGVLPLMLITLPCVLAVAFVSWHAIERPALSLKPRAYQIESALLARLEP